MKANKTPCQYVSHFTTDNEKEFSKACRKSNQIVVYVIYQSEQY